MATKPLPSQEVLRQLLDYDPETGVLRWKERGPEWFSALSRVIDQCSVWNTKHAGKPAFATVVPSGYLRGALFDHRYLAHRVIWKLMTGCEPDQIDHINGNRADNRWANLRSVDNQTNMKNTSLYATNTSGEVGVGRAKGKWRAQICVDGRPRHIGYFGSLEDAVAARKAAEREHGFHPNHGRAA